MLPVWIEKGLIQKVGIPQMENYGNIAERWKTVEWDPGREWTVPWQWGTTGVAVNRSVYDGDINTSAIWLDPPEELVGKVNVVPEMQDVVNLAIMYVGGEPCTEDRAVLEAARDALVAAKPKWMSMDYGMTEKLGNGDVPASVNWNGSTFRARNQNPDVAYGYPQEGYVVWMDNAAVLADAQNVEEAKTFLNFIMDPENAAMISSFARYANGIAGSEAFLPEDMRDAPEIVRPRGIAGRGQLHAGLPDGHRAHVHGHLDRAAEVGPGRGPGVRGPAGHDRCREAHRDRPVQLVVVPRIVTGRSRWTMRRRPSAAVRPGLAPRLARASRGSGPERPCSRRARPRLGGRGGLPDDRAGSFRATHPTS